MINFSPVFSASSLNNRCLRLLLAVPVCIALVSCDSASSSTNKNTQGAPINSDQSNVLNNDEPALEDNSAKALANEDSDNTGNTYTEFEPQVAEEAVTNAHELTPPVIASQPGIKAEDADIDSVTTIPMVNEVMPMAVASDMNVKTEGEETDDELGMQPITSSIAVKTEKEAAYWIRYR